MLITDCAFLENELLDVARLFQNRPEKIVHSFRFQDGVFYNDYEIDGVAYSFKDVGQVCDEITISTLGGEKTMRLFKADLLIKTDRKTDCKKDVYFAVSPHILSQEYQVLLHTCIIDEQT